MKFVAIRACLEKMLNFKRAIEIFPIQTTAKLIEVGVYQLMTFQFACCIETPWTFNANIRLHTIMSLDVFIKAIFAT